LRLEGIARVFHQGERDLVVLDGASLELQPGEIVSLVAPSGAGKSTLLHIAGLLERPDRGEVYIDGKPASALSDDARSALRSRRLGFVYQYHHLLPEFTAAENVMLPQMIGGLSRKEARSRAEQLLNMVGLAERADHRPGQLSGGEQQRVAIVRAVANGPGILLADEPTGNLDPTTAERVFGQLVTLVRETGLAALVATHNPQLAASMDRTVTLQDGALVSFDKGRLGEPVMTWPRAGK
jgi:lipoprotein-releasing system ATP-binding protein